MFSTKVFDCISSGLMILQRLPRRTGHDLWLLTVGSRLRETQKCSRNLCLLYFSSYYFYSSFCFVFFCFLCFFFLLLLFSFSVCPFFFIINYSYFVIYLLILLGLQAPFSLCFSLLHVLGFYAYYYYYLLFGNRRRSRPEAALTAPPSLRWAPQLPSVNFWSHDQFWSFPRF